MIIFDFDGTICNSIREALSIANELANKYQFNTISEEQFIQFRTKSIPEIQKELGIGPIKFIFLIHDIRRILHNRIKDLQPISGIVDPLKQLKSLGYRLGIVSSNLENSVRTFLSNNDLNIFKDISCFSGWGSGLWVKSRQLRKLIIKYGNEDTIYICDEIRDIQAAQAVDIKTIAVTWGANTKKAVTNLNPSIIIDHPSNLLAAIRYLQGIK